MARIDAPLEHRYVLGMRVDATSYRQATSQVLEWARRGESRYVCISTVHMVMESVDSGEFRQVVNGADLVTPDGMPLVWALRLQGAGSATRVYGPELMPTLCTAAAENGIPVGFYGGRSDVLDRLTKRLLRDNPTLKIVFAYSPPFRSLTEVEEGEIVAAIASSGARIIFVGLGCPKQERWMSRHRSLLPTVMLGVGAAFDFVAGVKPKAPRVLQRLGLEWLFRLLCEPRRLWRRYILLNPRFLFRFTLQMARRWASGPRVPSAG